MAKGCPGKSVLRRKTSSRLKDTGFKIPGYRTDIFDEYHPDPTVTEADVGTVFNGRWKNTRMIKSSRITALGSLRKTLKR